MIKTAILAMVLIGTMKSFGHEDHPPLVTKCASKKCTKVEIMAASALAATMIAMQDQRKASWANAKATNVEEKQFEKGPEYVLTYENAENPDGQKKLYIFITIDGYLNGSNYSGK